VDPVNKVYMLSMDGPFYEVDLNTLAVTMLYNLTITLDIDATLEQPHFKAAHSSSGLVWVASNTFEQADGLGLQHGGRLATWDGNVSHPWTIIEVGAQQRRVGVRASVRGSRSAPARALIVDVTSAACCRRRRHSSR